MTKALLIIIMMVLGMFSSAQNNDYYFPPNIGSDWEIETTENLQWNSDSIESLLSWLDEKNSKGFIVLHKGRMVVEHYFDHFTQDSIWYWASAGKSLTAALVGMAQEDGLLNINDKTSKYLGDGWTSCAKEKEDQITLWHQLTMSTGLNTNGVDLDCMTPECLNFFKDAGTRWFYHNAPYRLLQDVVAAASNTNFTLYTYNELGKKIGMKGMWYNYIRLGTARDMARFGLLILNKGVWDGETILGDMSYYNTMINTSQHMNPSYGYLWWLNGKGSYIQPGLSLTFNGDIIPSAPDEMFMAAGKNDQRIYIVPSRDLVLVRIGNAADKSALAISRFDDELWQKLMYIIDPQTSVSSFIDKSGIVWLNTISKTIQIETEQPAFRVVLFNAKGQRVYLEKNFNIKQVDVSTFQQGIYFCIVATRNGLQTQKIRIQ